MCIMAMPVRSVSNTRIFIGTDGTRQLTIYEMAVELAARRQAANSTVAPGNAMILPAPAESPEDIELIDMTKDKGFFDGLDRIFANPRGMRSRSLSKGMSDSLKVHQVGSYSVSIADTLNDLDRLNPEVFTLSPAAKQALGPNYSRINGPKHVFIVATLRESGKFHPLAYTHPNPADGRLFVPTRHEHGDGEGETASWDHHIYHQSPRADFSELPSGKNHRVALTAEDNTKYVVQPWARYTVETVPELAPFIFVGESAPIVRSKFSGTLKNMDLRLAVGAA
jgi:hypothetical protein